MRNFFKGAFIVAVLTCSMQIFAASSPVAQLQNIANNILSALNKNYSSLKGPSHAKVVHRIVERYLVPSIAINRMAATVVGRNVWVKASSSQRNAFVKQFKYLVINTYASAFASYNRDKIMFYPLRGSYANKKYLRVNSVIIRKSGQKIPISYNLLRNSSKWYIYDFSIENVSMVRSYRSQFSSILSSGGIRALINKLKAHNASKR